MTTISLENIILTGFMATGKTTVGKLLAAKINFTFVDTDEMIRIQQGRTIPDLFQKYGETAFRKMETDVAGDLAKQTGLVISTGGRMMLDPTNVNLLSKRGQVFCLTASPDVILQRLNTDTANNRPLLDVEDPKARILQLLEERKKGYQQFHKIDTDKKTPPTVAQDILFVIQKRIANNSHTY
jgi:shikimate kinase